MNVDEDLTSAGCFCHSFILLILKAFDHSDDEDVRDHEDLCRPGGMRDEDWSKMRNDPSVTICR